MIRVSDYIISQLYDFGVECLFMVTGRGSLFLTDAVAAHKKIKSVCLHHEQSAAYAAVSYADYNEKIGGCLVSTGCASTNALTGVLNAWQDGIPCIFISGQNKLIETSYHTGIPLRTYGQQETNLIPIVSSITKYAVMLTDANNIGYEMSKAFQLATTGRKGPVWIDIPLDIQNQRINPNSLKLYSNKLTYVTNKNFKKDINYLYKKIKKSERPTILIGRGVRSANAIPDLEKFIKKTGIPLTYASSAPDTYGSYNNLSIGSVGAMGCSRSGNFAVQNTDLLIVLGCRLTSMTTGDSLKDFARSAKIIVIDIDPVEHSKKSVNIEKLILADLKNVLAELNKTDLGLINKVWRNKCLHWKKNLPTYKYNLKKRDPVDLYFFADKLSKTIPKKSVFISDSGLIELILPTNLKFKKNQRCIHPTSQGSMGFALPAILGAFYASNLPIIAVIGDGSIMMNLQELETIRYHKIPVKIFIINNNAYAIIRKRQNDLFRKRTIGVDHSDGISCPNFKKVAKAFDFTYYSIKDSQSLIDNLEFVINQKGPLICEINGKHNQVYLHTSYAKNSKNRLVRRPIEDQSPFLERDLFESEMIIAPLD